MAHKLIPDRSGKNGSRIVSHVTSRLVDLNLFHLDHEESHHTECVRQTTLGHNTDYIWATIQ